MLASAASLKEILPTLIARVILFQKAEEGYEVALWPGGILKHYNRRQVAAMDV